MKLFAVTFVSVLAASTAHAYCDGQGEAQIIATATSSAQISSQLCRVEIAPPRFFQPNGLCPLERDIVLMNAIRVKAINGTCPNVGDDVSGVVELRQDGELVIQN